MQTVILPNKFASIHGAGTRDMFDTSMRGKLTTIDAVKNYALGGKATITIRSQKTDTRFTYQVRAPKESVIVSRRPIWFVSVLTGKDNEHDYQYIGQIFDTYDYVHGKKAKIAHDAPSAHAFNWYWNQVIRANNTGLFHFADIWHEGQCGKCGRKLTVPESIESGFGPECIKYVGNRSYLWQK